MTSWYKMNPIDWNDGTDDLTLEQEAAYLRICHAIYITERPIKANGFVVAGLLRCGERKASRLLDELVAAGKLAIADGVIVNRRALDEVATRARVSGERKSAGSRGGVASAKSRSKSLKTNDWEPAIASTDLKQNRTDESREITQPASQQVSAARPPVMELEKLLFQAAGIAGFREERHPRLMDLSPIYGLIDAGYDLHREILPIIRERSRNKTFSSWRFFCDAVVDSASANRAIPAKPAPQQEDWPKRMAVWNESRTWSPAWGPKPDEPRCRVPDELLRTAA